MKFEHRTVLLDEAVEALNINPDGIYVDATLGGAGHTEQIASRLNAGKLFCFDRDIEAISAARERLGPLMQRVELIHNDFRNIKEVLGELGLDGIDGILFDLGVSSPQLDNAQRGFSYQQDAPLDMRMDAGAPLTAYDVVNVWPASEIRRILYDYGQERYGGLIASAIERRRQAEPIRTTLELVDVIRSAMPAHALREKQHPAKRSFQAIRIAVNDELGALEQALRSAVELLRPGGRIAVITFHSLEDKIVKSVFTGFIKSCICPPEFPVCVCNRKPQLKSISRHPIAPTQQEIDLNPRARSAKLRIAEKI